MHCTETHNLILSHYILLMTEPTTNIRICNIGIVKYMSIRTKQVDRLLDSRKILNADANIPQSWCWNFRMVMLISFIR